MKSRTILVFVFILLIGVALPCKADLFNNGGVHNITDGSYRLINLDNPPPTSPAFTTLNFGGTAIAFSLESYNNSQVILNGGHVMYGFSATDNSQVTMNGGSVTYSFYANDNSQLTVNGGSISEYLVVEGNIQVIVNGGSAGDPGRGLRAGGNSRVTINDGATHRVCANDNSHVIVNGRELWGWDPFYTFSVSNYGQITLDGYDYSIYDTHNNLLYSGYGVLDSIYDGCTLKGTLASGDYIRRAHLRIQGYEYIHLTPIPPVVLLDTIGFSFFTWMRRRRMS